MIFRLQTRKNSIKANRKYEELYDKTLKEVNFKMGDKVYLLKEPRSNKLDPHWERIYGITQLFSNYNAEIDLGYDKRKIVHLNKLKHAFIRGAPM